MCKQWGFTRLHLSIHGSSSVTLTDRATHSRRLHKTCIVIALTPWHWRTQGGGVWGVQTPRNYSEVLTKPSRISSSVENRSLETNKNTGFTHLQIGRNPWLWGYRPLSLFTLPSVLNWICWTPPPPKKKLLGTPLRPWNRVLDKLVKKFPTFYGTRRFITPFKNTQQSSLS
jgi:hypothetical protein